MNRKERTEMDNVLHRVLQGERDSVNGYIISAAALIPMSDEELATFKREEYVILGYKPSAREWVVATVDAELLEHDTFRHARMYCSYDLATRRFSQQLRWKRQLLDAIMRTR